MKHILLALFLLSSTNLFAANKDEDAPETLESSANLDLNGDNSHDKGIGLSTEIGFNSEYKGDLGFSSVKNTDPDSPFTTKDFNLGFGTDTSKKVSYNISIDSSTTPSEFKSTSFIPEIFWNANKNWAWHFIPGFRKIKLYAGDATNTVYDLSSFYLTAGFNYLGLKHWHFKAEFTSARYNRSRSDIKLNKKNIALFAPALLNSSSSLQKSIATIAGGYSFPIMSLSLEASSATSAIEKISTKTVTVKTIWFVAEDWDLGFNLGSSRVSESVNGKTTTTFGDLNLTYYWN